MLDLLAFLKIVRRVAARYDTFPVGKMAFSVGK